MQMLENANEVIIHGYAYQDWIREIANPQVGPQPTTASVLHMCISLFCYLPLLQLQGHVVQTPDLRQVLKHLYSDNAHGNIVAGTLITDECLCTFQACCIQETNSNLVRTVLVAVGLLQELCCQLSQ